jgi:hypothetical protein
MKGKNPNPYRHQGSISPTLYARLFRTKVLRKAFLYLDLSFVLFWRKNIGAKAACNMLVKLIPGADFTKLFSTTEKLPANAVWRKIRHLISPTKLKLKFGQNLLIIVCFLPNALRHSPNAFWQKSF